jgi:dihydropteroate synthase
MFFKDTFFSKNRSLNCGGKLFDLSTPKVMGIVNVTPDSFYDGGKLDDPERMLDHIRRMVNEGADILDVGGMSTRPGSEPVSETEEIKRLLPALQIIRNHFPDIIISVDTYRANVARMAVRDYSAGIINDISGGELDPGMFDTMADLHIPYIIMHMKGSPRNMQMNIHYDDIINELLEYFAEKVTKLKSMGLNDIIIDPGFGFSKSIDQNFYLLGRLEVFQVFELPVMAGISRKSMIYKTLGTDPGSSLNGTSVLNTAALLKGVNIIRVHDVAEAVQTVKLVEKILLNLHYD